MEEGEEEEDKEDDDCVDPEAASERRHYAKARKFGRLMKKGLIPDEILTLYQDASTQQKQPRLFRTELVNRLFKKTKSGEYVLCHDSPEFQSWKRNTDQAWATQKTEGVAYSIMLWNTFHGSETGFQDAAARGDICQENGMWYHTVVSAGRTKSSTDTQQLASGSVKLDTESFAAFNKFLGSRKLGEVWADYGLGRPEETFFGSREKPTMFGEWAHFSSTSQFSCCSSFSSTFQSKSCKAFKADLEKS